MNGEVRLRFQRICKSEACLSRFFVNCLDQADVNEFEDTILTAFINEKASKLKEGTLTPYEDKYKQCLDS